MKKLVSIPDVPLVNIPYNLPSASASNDDVGLDCSGSIIAPAIIPLFVLATVSYINTARVSLDSYIVILSVELIVDNCGVNVAYPVE